MRCDKLKPRIITTIALAFILFFSQIIISPQEAMAAQPSVVLSGVKGEVLVKKGGGLRELPAANGMELVQGDWLRTGKNGTAKLSYGDGTEATIGSYSSLTIQRLSKSDSLGTSALSDARVTFSENGQQSSLQLWSGSVWSKVKSLLNMDDSYEVETPTAVMGVRGTLYLVSVNPENGATQGDVIEGVVGVSQNNEGTHSPPIQLVTMGQTLRLVSLDEPMPGNQVIDPQELIRSTQAELLVQLVNDIMERAKDLTVLTQEQKQAYEQTGVVDHLKAAIGTSFKVNELANFGKEFVTSLKTSDKLEGVKKVLKENNQSIEQLQSTIDTMKKETEKIRSKVIEAAKEAGVSGEEIESIEKMAAGIPPTPDSVTMPRPTPTPPTPPAPPNTGSNNGGGSSSSGITTVISTHYLVSAGIISNVPYATSRTAFLANVQKGESHQTWNTSGVHDPVQNNDQIVVTAQNGTQTTYLISVADLPVVTPVSDFACTSKTDTTATFTWTPSIGATEIQIEKTLTGVSAAWATATTGTISVNAGTATVTGLTEATGYDFRMVVTGGINAGISNTLVNVVTEATSDVDISSSFTDDTFRKAVWEWLGKSGTPGAFTKQDLIERMASQDNRLDAVEMNISSLDGLENFEGTGLEELYCFYNKLSSLPPLPSSLKILDCSNNELSSLPTLPIGLNKLWCEENQLSNLPTLPTNLETLMVNYNYLNIFTGDLETALEECTAANQVLTPQYRYYYTGGPVIIETATIYNILGTELSRQQSSDGINWSDTIDGDITKFTFTSSDDEVASVDSEGLITAHNQGACVIEVRFGNIDSDFTRILIPVTVLYDSFQGAEAYLEPTDRPDELYADINSTENFV